VERFVEQTMEERRVDAGGARAAAGGSVLPELPEVDFSKFGPIETRPLGRIRRLAARNVHRSWLHVPHVTQHDQADITEMEAFRKAEAPRAEQRGFKLTPLVFIMKAVVAGLEELPDFNSSLHRDGEHLILKKYFHLGIAVDTPAGLVVPVIRDVDKKGLFELAEELAEVSSRAREGKMKLSELQGACFSISSLGGIGGTAFTPIVSAPEVAILGVSRAQWRPVYRDGELEPRLMLPLSLSYDHRVIDGAAAVRFTTYLSRALGDVRRLLL
jgi:pyruvate dehydrogenase E2 component (dihydrolipoamide acetyltransferase)